jgi:hypothetical protein
MTHIPHPGMTAGICGQSATASPKRARTDYAEMDRGDRPLRMTQPGGAACLSSARRQRLVSPAAGAQGVGHG